MSTEIAASNSNPFLELESAQTLAQNGYPGGGRADISSSSSPSLLPPIPSQQHQHDSDSHMTSHMTSQENNRMTNTGMHTYVRQSQVENH